MNVFAILENNIPQVASLMARIKPDWWDYEGGVGQLSDIGCMIETIGWFMGIDEWHPQGWLLCRVLKGYSCLEIECLGYDDAGTFVMEHQLKPLLDAAEQYARDNGLRMLRYFIGSRDMSCHGRELGEYWRELKELQSFGRAHYDWFIEYGFQPAGFLPHCLGENYHCIMMVKQIKGMIS